MIVDSSAILAVLLLESDAAKFAADMNDAPVVRISVVNYVEIAGVQLGRKNAIGRRQLEAFVEALKIKLEPVTVAQAMIARDAYFDFGRGSKSKAKLNMGDCFAYALAKALDEPLLFKGKDFTHTDIRDASKL